MIDFDDYVSRLNQLSKKEFLETLKSEDNGEHYVGGAIEFLSDHVKNDKEVALEIVRRNGDDYQWLNSSLKNDQEVLLEAIKEDEFYFNGPAILDAPEDLQNNRDFIIKAVSVNGYCLENVNENFKNDRDIVMAAVSTNKEDGQVIRFANNNLKKDKEIILAAIKNARDLDSLPCIWDEIDETLHDDEDILKAYNNWELES
jgi:hypothetical protein